MYKYGNIMKEINSATHKKKNLRILQLTTMYTPYMNELYSKNSELKQQKYIEQLNFIIRDGYNAIHLFTPYLFGCETLLVFANCTFLQSKWYEENYTGNDKYEHRTLNEIELARLQIEIFRPDVLYIAPSLQYDGRFIRSLKFRPPCIIGWHAANLPLTTDWHGFDAIASGLPKLLEVAKSLGASQGILFNPYMPDWIPKCLGEVEKDIDVVFAGSFMPGIHDERKLFMEKVAEAALSFGFSLAIYVDCDPLFVKETMRPFIKPAVFGFDMYKALSRGRIVIDKNVDCYALLPNGEKMMNLLENENIKMRLFEATASGALLLTDAASGLRRYFEDGKEVVTHTSVEDAIDKINYYLNNENERLAISKSGKERCRTEWNTKKGAQMFLEIAQSIISQKNNKKEQTNI